MSECFRKSRGGAAEGEPADFDELYVRYRPAVVRYLSRIPVRGGGRSGDA